MIDRIKTAPLSVKVAIGILGLCLLALVYIAPVMITIIIAIVWALKTVIDYYFEDMTK